MRTNHARRPALLACLVLGLTATAAHALPPPSTARVISVSPNGFAAPTTASSFTSTVTGSNFNGGGSVGIYQCEAIAFGLSNGYNTASSTPFTNVCKLLASVNASGGNFSVDVTLTDTFTSQSGASMNCRKPSTSISVIPGGCGVFAQLGTSTTRRYFTPISFEGPYKCGSRVATLVGTYYDDTINGTTGNDVIMDPFGDNTLNGLEGDDWICGGPGIDRIVGHAGGDMLSGGSGNDKISGGLPADDTYTTCVGTSTVALDYLYGGSGNDVMNGCAQQDFVSGDSGNDTLYGSDGNDTLNGGTGGDVIYGEAGDDTLNGESGSDARDGGTETDTCYGGIDTDPAANACETVSNIP